MSSLLREVRGSLEEHLSQLALHRFRAGVGLEVGAPPRMPALERAELFHETREARERTDKPEGKRRASGMLALIAEEHERGVAREAEAALRERTRAAMAVTEDEALPLSEALYQLPREPSRPRRERLERAAGATLWELRGFHRRRLDASQRAAEQLGFSSPAQRFTVVSGIDLAALQADADQALRATEDAYRDVLGYVIHKLDPKLSPLPNGSARRPDAQFAMRGLFPDLFRREDVVPATHRWLGELGFTPHAGGRIRHDAEAREGRSPRPFVAAVRVPGDIRLALIPETGLEGAGALLHELGHAHALAHVTEELPVEDRRLGDASVSEAWALLFEHLLTDPRWLRRYLSVPSMMGKDVARVAAFGSLLLLRRSAARLRMEARLEEGGTDEALSEDYAELQRAALFLDVDPRFVLHDRDPHRYVTRYLRGWALEARLRPVLEQRFDEDFWRNPDAGSFLTGLWARAGEQDAAALSEELAGAPLSLVDAGMRLVRILGA